MGRDSLNLETREQWDDRFFADWVDLRNEVNTKLGGFLPEKVSDLEAFFGKQSPFHKKNAWLAMAVKRGGRIVARAAVSLPEYWKNPAFVPFGFFDAFDDSEAVALMVEEAVRWARERGVTEIRGPINGNFFSTYRYCLANPQKPFFGEPICPIYYAGLLEKSGFTQTSTWTSDLIAITEQTRDNRAIIGRFIKGQPIESRLKLRPLDLARWDEELGLVHRLFTESYGNMGEFMPISWDEFKLFYDPVRNIVRTDMTYFLELDGKTVGFIISYFDPQPILEWYESSVLPVVVKKAIAFARLKRNRRRLLVPYVGKTPDAPAELKGVLAYLIQTVLDKVPPKDADLMTCYVYETSTSNKTISDAARVHSRYGIWTKTL